MILALCILVGVALAVDWLQTLKIVTPGSGKHEQFNKLLAWAVERAGDSARRRWNVVHGFFLGSSALLVGILLLSAAMPRYDALAGFVLGFWMCLELLCVRTNWRLGVKP